MPSILPVAFKRTALVSSSRPTMSCSMSCSGGLQMAPAMPCTLSSTMACHICSWPLKNSTPQLIETSMNSPCEAWMSRRQSYLSASAPKYTDSNRNGSQWLITAKPASSGDWNVCHSTQ